MRILPALPRILTLLALCGAAPQPPGAAAAAPSTVAISARRFEFVPNTIRLKRGETVKLLVTSEDVTHGFFQRALKIDADLFPGETSEITLTPQTEGTFTVICDHFCGAQHGNMKMTLVVE